ncbi:MAG: diguanylate cyclase [Eubacteriaceae bacterium]|nr:diguanylate cyclase [Eubacteriaceae bacterium]
MSWVLLVAANAIWTACAVIATFKAVSNIFDSTVRDQLTGAFNRRYLQTQNLVKATSKYPVSYIAGDLNGLKLVNDVFGHIKGDETIVNAVRLMNQACEGKKHKIIRMGGDEFLLIVAGCDGKCANSLTASIAALEQSGSDRVWQTTLSLGSATAYSKEDGFEEMVQLADADMYANKSKDSRRVKMKIESKIDEFLYKSQFEPASHIVRLLALSSGMAKLLGLSKEETARMELLCKYHDMGKLAVPENLLFLDAKPSGKDLEQIRSHVEKGYNIAKQSYSLVTIALDILAHHENFDGTGYPQRLEGEDIPLNARVLRVIHTYDRLMHPEPSGKKAASKQEARNFILAGSNKMFDPKVANALLTLTQA